MMEKTRAMKAMFITGGTDSGIMKHVGEARAKYNPTAPLIGIAPMGPINATPSLHALTYSVDKGTQKTAGLGTGDFVAVYKSPVPDSQVKGLANSGLKQQEVCHARQVHAKKSSWRKCYKSSTADWNGRSASGNSNPATRHGAVSIKRETRRSSPLRG